MTERRRVFFLLDSFMIGGTETQAVELARRLPALNYDVTIGCLQMEGPLLERLRSTPVRVVHIDLGGGVDSPSGMLALIRLARFLRREGFEILHAHDLWSNLAGMVAAVMGGVPVRITSQRDLSHLPWYGTRYRRRILRFVQARSSMILTNAKAIRDGLIQEEGLPEKKVCVVYNGVDLERLQRVPRNREALFPGSTGNKLVVLVGNMISDVKGHRTLISAAPEILRCFPRTQFVLVGDGVKRNEFEAQVEQLGLKKHFLFLGRRTDVPEILACADIGILPSRAEGLPNAVLEYLASGLPVVASALGGNLEVIEDGVTGVLIPPEDPARLADALTRLMEDEPLALKLAAAGRDHVSKNFSFERLGGEIDKLYSRLLQAKDRSELGPKDQSQPVLSR
ncbi:MAG: glycosyltransferase [Acidobacteria bacterium]|nr:glycosyltransferase [Acidobacteriota bacterium]